MSTTWRRMTAPIDHRWAQPRLSAYLEGDLPPRHARRLRGHAGICPECGRALRRLRALLRTLPLLREREPDVDSIADRTAEAVRRRIDDEAADGPSRPPP